MHHKAALALLSAAAIGTAGLHHHAHAHHAKGFRPPKAISSSHLRLAYSHHRK